MSKLQDEMLDRHTSEAAFLWSQRDLAVRSPAFTLGALADLDERLGAQIAGLVLAGEAGSAACADAITRDPEPGAYFAAASVALARDDLGAFAELLDGGAGDPKRGRAIVAALGFAPFDRVRAVLPGFLEDDPAPELLHLGIAACAAHRYDPGAALANAVASPDARIRGRAIRAAGELGRGDLRGEIAQAAWTEDAGVRFWSAWSAALLGDTTGVPHLLTIALQRGPFAARACDLAMRLLPPPMALTWLRSLSMSNPRAALFGAAGLGDPGVMPWILESLGTPALARAAGFAFAAITGADLAADQLRGDVPEGFVKRPNDDPADADVGMDPDHGLQWPDPEKVTAFWRARAGTFGAGKRYVMGKPVSAEHLEAALRRGSQPVRAGAALELYLGGKRRPLFNTAAPAARQRAEL